MGKNQKDKKEGKQENKAAAPSQERKLQEKEIEEKEDTRLKNWGQMTLDGNEKKRKIHLLSIIGEVEGHENASGGSKTTKYDHVLPALAQIEDDATVEGLLVLLNTSGGDVDAGLAIAEMIASMSIPVVSLVLGGSHSVRMSGMVIGTAQTYEYFAMIQDRILNFVSSHADIAYDQLKALMHNTKMLARDLGTVLVGQEAVDAGLIKEVGGIREALKKLYEMIDESCAKKQGC